MKSTGIKGILVGLITLVIIGGLVPHTLIRTYAAHTITVKVDGTVVAFPDQQPYINTDNRTMVPVRAPMEAMGCAVVWNEHTKQASISKNGTAAVFTIDSTTYSVNGESRTMDTKAVITGSRTAFPIRFAAEALGARVDWDPQSYTVNISTQVKVKQMYIDCSKLTSNGTIIKNYVGLEISAYPMTLIFDSLDSHEYRFVCINHPELNTKISCGYEETISRPHKLDTGYYGHFIIANNNGASFENGFKITKGMVLKYDIYNETGFKVYEATFQM